MAQWQTACKWHSGRPRAAQVCKQVFDNWSHARHYRLVEWRNFTRGFVSDFNQGAEKFAPRTSGDVLAAFWKYISCFQAYTAHQNFRLVVMLFTNCLTLLTAYTYLPVIAYGRYVYEIEWQCLANFSHKCWIVRIWYLVKLTATRSWAVLPRSCFPCNNVFLQKSVFSHIVVC